MFDFCKVLDQYFIETAVEYPVTEALDYRQTSDISRTLIGNTFVDHSNVVGACPPAPTTSSFSTSHQFPMDWAKTAARRDEKLLSFGGRHMKTLTHMDFIYLELIPR